MNNPYQTCSQCGTPLAPGQTFCNNCGKRVEPSGAGPTQRASGYSSPSNPGYGQQVPPTQYAGPPSTPPPPSTPYSSDPYSTPQYGSTAYGGGAGAPPPPPDAGYQVPQYPSPTYPPSIGGGGQFPPQMPQQPGPKKGANIGLIVGGVILAIVVICGASFWALSTLGKQNTTQTTPTVTNATPTPTAVPTPKALFTENFADNHNNWDIGSDKGYSRSISGGTLKMMEANHKFLLNKFPQTPPVDSTISVGFTLVSGDNNDGVGLLTRASNNNDLYGYYIEVYGNDTYDIESYYLDTVTNKGKVETLLDFSSTGLNPKGQQNVMTVTIKGSNITLAMNGQTIKTVIDNNNRFTSGASYLFSANGKTSTGVTATFSNVTVYPTAA